MDNLTRTSHSGYRIRGGSLPAVIAVVFAVSLFTAAGFWQLQRAHYKDALRARIEAAMHDAVIELSASPMQMEEIDFRAVHVRGEWIAERTIFLDNKVNERVVGYHVVTPLRIGSGDMHVLVNRGWIAAKPLRSELPAITTSDGAVEVSGIARAPSQRFIELSDRIEEGEQGRLWQNLTIKRFKAWSGLALQPVVVYQQNPCRR
jgi:surfeit locus 1 family protein